MIRNKTKITEYPNVMKWIDDKAQDFCADISKCFQALFLQNKGEDVAMAMYDAIKIHYKH